MLLIANCYLKNITYWFFCFYNATNRKSLLNVNNCLYRIRQYPRHFEQTFDGKRQNSHARIVSDVCPQHANVKESHY